VRGEFPPHITDPKAGNEKRPFLIFIEMRSGEREEAGKMGLEN